MSKYLRTMLLAGTLAIASSASALDFDQMQHGGEHYIADFDQVDIAQSFKPGHGNLAGAGIWLHVYGSTDNVVISLWDALPDEGGAMLATGSAMGTAGNWVNVFWDPVPVTIGTTYFLVFTGNETLGIKGQTDNPYPHGQCYANPGFGSFPEFDYAFHTYYDQTAATGSSWSELRDLY